MKRLEIIEKIIELKVVPVIGMEDPLKLTKVAEEIHDGGVKAIEITMTALNAIETSALALKEIGNKVLIEVEKLFKGDGSVELQVKLL